MSKNTQLIETETLTAAEVFTDGKINDLVERVEKIAASKEFDVTTKKGRGEIASFAYSVSRSKTALDELGKKFTEDTKKKIKIIDDQRKDMREALDRVRDDVRKPLTDYEEAEKKRVETHRGALNSIETCVEFNFIPTEGDLKNLPSHLDDFYDRDFEEFQPIANKKYKESKEKLEKIIAEHEQRKAEQAELEKLRREAAERAEKDRIAEEARKQKERDERIAKEAVEKADADRKEAEEIANARLHDALKKEEESKHVKVSELQQEEFDMHEGSEAQIADEEKEQQDDLFSSVPEVVVLSDAEKLTLFDELVEVMEKVASIAGQDWLEGQLMLIEVLNKVK